jgi:glycine oxidase
VAATSDIVVIGAGIVGCAVACELARRGAGVQIVDQRPAGMGATQASAGVLAPYIEAAEGGPLLDLTARSLALFDAFVERTAADSGMSIAYRRNGTLEVALDAEAVARLTHTAAALVERGVEAQLLDAAATRAAEPQLSKAAAGGLLIPGHGHVAALDLTRALAAAARRHGAHLIEGGQVRSVSRRGSDLVVETQRGPLSGQAVVMAAGSWSGRIAIEGLAEPPPVRPVRGQLLTLAWPGTPFERVLWSERCYAVPWQDGTVLVGATVEEAGFDERTTVAGVRDLLDAASDLLPAAWTAAFTGARAGLRPGTPDGLPIIGRSQVLPNFMYATGHYRNGVLLSALTAQAVADSLLDNREDPMLTVTSPRRFGAL